MKQFTATLLLLILSIGAYCQLGTKVKEFNRGRLQIAGSTYGHPYTMFDIHNGKSFEETIDSIRSRIKSENKGIPNLPIALAYLQIYDNTQEPMPGDNGMPYDKESALALWAKNNAFVMLVGLDKFGNELTLDKRDTFKLNVLKAFDALQGEINNTASLIVEVYDNLVVSERFKFFARSHILWLQAYDLLKASAALPELSTIKYADNYDSDANISWYSPRNKLRLNTRNLYKMSNGPLGLIEHAVGWKKNHGIICASVLGMAAIILHDASSRDLRFKYNPKNWHTRAVGDGGSNIINVGEDGLEDLFFIGKHNGNLVGVKNVPQTNSEGTSGFA